MLKQHNQYRSAAHKLRDGVFILLLMASAGALGYGISCAMNGINQQSLTWIFYGTMGIIITTYIGRRIVK